MTKVWHTSIYTEIFITVKYISSIFFSLFSSAAVYAIYAFIKYHANRRFVLWFSFIVPHPIQERIGWRR